MDRVAVVDYGSQFTQLIARRIREAHVYSEIFPPTVPLERLRGYQAIVLSGGPASVYDAGAPLPPPALYEAGVPVLGICYGMQAMAAQLGGKVVPAEHREYGRAGVRLLGGGALFEGVEPEAAGAVTVWMSHGDTVLEPPPGFVPLGATDDCPVAAMADPARRLFAVHFHPEVAHTPQGGRILQNFLFRIARLTAGWTMASFVDEAVAAIGHRVGRERVLCALSGGVDSSVVAVLAQRAVGDQLTCVFVDNGLLRKGEGESVRRTFREHFHMNLVYVDASRRFLERLAGVTDPEDKRKRIGAEFIAVFREEAQKLGRVPFLAQGTLYPDVIESGHGVARATANIKLHHNVGGLPAELGFELVEPLRDLFKDEVRVLGELLSLPEGIVWRHPFPGPGLAVRIIGEVTRARCDLLRQADQIIIEEIASAGWYRRIAQAFGVLLPVASVGVMGDGRSYGSQNVLVVRLVESTDFMTADWVHVDPAILARISTRLTNEVAGINRVVYDVTSKPPGTIEWE